jgi:ATP-dependent Clp protease ATP-binding subunit ClpA
VFERFTEHARQVIVLAQDEALGLRHNYIGTEHLLLGLLRVEDSLAADLLNALGVTIDDTRAEVTKTIGPGDEAVTGQVPFTPRAKRVLELSMQEARGLGHNYIATEHLLLALGSVKDGVAAQILLARGADAERVRAALEGVRANGSGVEEPRADEPPWRKSYRGVQYMVVTHEPSDGSSRLLGLWLAAPTVGLAAAVLFGLGLLVGWLIWG